MNSEKIIQPTVILAALGYFVDIFDTVLYGMLRVPSIRDLIHNGGQIEQISRNVDNWQLFGLLFGGLLWGILADRYGRLKVLYASILMYSLATLGSGLVQDISAYALLRFIAGVGLAGELGTGITLVNELLSKEKRGLATAFIAVIGILGAIAAGLIVSLVHDWRLVYFIGGGLGLLLLLLRLSVKESQLYQKIKSKNIPLGQFSVILTNKRLRNKYLALILLAFPLTYIVHLYGKYMPELAVSLGIRDQLDSQLAINSMMLVYFGLSVGDLFSALLSNNIKSRKKAIAIFIALTAMALILFWTIQPMPIGLLYVFIFFLGFTAGYWAVYISLITENFGTNIRATATTSIPNFVRGLAIIINLLYVLFKDQFHLTTVHTILVIGVLSLFFGAWAIFFIPETFGKNLDYIEN